MRFTASRNKTHLWTRKKKYIYLTTNSKSKPESKKIPKQQRPPQITSRPGNENAPKRRGLGRQTVRCDVTARAVRSPAARGTFLATPRSPTTGSSAVTAHVCAGREHPVTRRDSARPGRQVRGKSRPRGPVLTQRQLRIRRSPGSLGRRGDLRQRHPSSGGDTSRGTGRRVPQELSTPLSPFRVHLGRAPPVPKALSPRCAGAGTAGRCGGAPGAAPCPAAAAAARGAAAPPGGQHGALRSPPGPARLRPRRGCPGGRSTLGWDPGGPRAGLSPHRPRDGGRGAPRSAEAASLSAGVRALTSHLLFPSVLPAGADIAGVISASPSSLFPPLPRPPPKKNSSGALDSVQGSKVIGSVCFCCEEEIKAVPPRP